MDTTSEKEARVAQNNLEKDCDGRVKRGDSLDMARGTTFCKGLILLETDHSSFLTQDEEYQAEQAARKIKNDTQSDYR